MKLNKNKRGISLIVLVITIIVMIILATAIILSLSGSDMRNKANEAVSSNDISTAKEVIAVAQSEWELNYDELLLEYGDFKNYATKKLEKSGIDTSNIGLSDEGKILVGIAAMFANNTVKIGDKVEYKYIANNNVECINTNYPGVGPYSSAKGGNLEITEWRVIAIKNNSLVLVGVLPNEGSHFTTFGAVNSETGISELNRMCSELYSSDFGIARSAKESDVGIILNNNIDILQPCWLADPHKETWDDPGAWIIESHGLKYLENNRIEGCAMQYKDVDGNTGMDSQRDNYICPIIELNADVTTTGKNQNGEWVLK